MSWQNQFLKTPDKIDDHLKKPKGFQKQEHQSVQFPGVDRGYSCRQCASLLVATTNPNSPSESVPALMMRNPFLASYLGFQQRS